MKDIPQPAVVALLASPSVADIETRRREIGGEEKALRTLLRSLKARERALRNRSAKQQPEVARG